MAAVDGRTAVDAGTDAVDADAVVHAAAAIVALVAAIGATTKPKVGLPLSRRFARTNADQEHGPRINAKEHE
jgi:hypothetical protein